MTHVWIPHLLLVWMCVCGQCFPPVSNPWKQSCMLVWGWKIQCGNCAAGSWSVWVDVLVVEIITGRWRPTYWVHVHAYVHAACGRADRQADTHLSDTCTYGSRHRLASTHWYRPWMLTHVCVSVHWCAPVSHSLISAQACNEILL